jgi:hypothetical protein
MIDGGVAGVGSFHCLDERRTRTAIDSRFAFLQAESIPIDLAHFF